MGERARTAALVASLLLLATILAALGTGLSQSTLQPVPPGHPAMGELLVTVEMIDPTNGSSAISRVSNASVSVSRIPSNSITPLVFRTNSSGEFSISFATGAYAVSVSDSQFQKSVSVVVQENMTTEVDATVIRHSYPVLFSDMQDRYSADSVAPWSYIFVGMSPSSGIQLNDSLFIDGSRGSFVTFYATNTTSAESGNLTLVTGQPATLSTTSASGEETRALLISSNLYPSAEPKVLWLTLQPESFISLSGLLSLSLATYSAGLQVTIHAG